MQVEPRVVSGQDENRLTGYAGLPFARNPYLDDGYFSRVLAAGALSPAPGVYSVVFDSKTRERRGPLQVPLLGERRDAADAPSPDTFGPDAGRP